MNEYKENQTADHIPESSSVLRAGNSVVRDSHRQSRSTFVAHPSCGYDGFGPDTKGTKPELRRRRRRTAEMMKWRKTMGSPTTMLERIVQQTWLLVPYTAIIVTIILILEIVYHA